MGNDPVPVIPATWTRYSKLQTVGAGSYGQVYLAEGNPEKGGMEGVHVVKRVHVADLPEEEMRGAINEVQILSLLNHFNIISYTDHFVDADGFLNIVMEHCSQGDLSKRIETCKAANSHFKQNEIAFWAFQLAQGMKYIHSIGIIHRDLKPANIFLTGMRFFFEHIFNALIPQLTTPSALPTSASASLSLPPLLRRPSSARHSTLRQRSARTVPTPTARTSGVLDAFCTS